MCERNNYNYKPDRPETVKSKQHLCCADLREWLFKISMSIKLYLCIVPSLSDPQRTQVPTSFTRQKSMATPQCTSISTYTSIQMSVHAHTHSYIPRQRVSQWETGTNCSGRGKCLCSESKSNCLAGNKANGMLACVL